MLSENTKSKLAYLLNSEMKDDTESLIELFDEVLEIPPHPSIETMPSRLRKAIEQFLGSSFCEAELVLNDIAVLMESFCKHILFIVDPQKLNSTTAPMGNQVYQTFMLADLYKSTGLGLINDSKVLKSYRPKTVPDRYYMTAYHLRNGLTHASESIGFAEVQAEARDTICAFLMVIKKYRRQLEKSVFVAKADRLIDFRQYCKHIVQIRKDDNQHYVPLLWKRVPDMKENGRLITPKEMCEIKTVAAHLVGGAGTGKTCFMKQMEYLLAKKGEDQAGNPLIPVYIELKELSFSESLPSLFSKKTGVPEADFNTCVSSGLFVLLLDGYDEIVEKQVKMAFSSLIDRLLEMNHAPAVIISDRAGTKARIPLSMKLQEYHPHTLTDDDKRMLIEKYCNHNEIRRMLNQKLKEEPSFFSEFQTPLQIRQLAEMADYTQSISFSPDDFTKFYIDYLLRRETQEKKNPNTHALRVFLEALSITGGDSWKKLQIQAEFTRCRSIVGYASTDTEDCFNLALELGMLIPGENNEYSFCSDDLRTCFEMEAYQDGLAELMMDAI